MLAFLRRRRIMRGISMLSLLHRIFILNAIALIAFTALARAQVPQTDPREVPQKEQHNADVLEKLARQEFGELSVAERIFVRGATSREVRWVGTSDNPDDASNDLSKSDKWGPERS